jgi:hypothetical protein
MPEDSGAQPAPEPQKQDQQQPRESEAPQQPGPEVTPSEEPEGEPDRTVHLPAILADEFGISRSEARMEVMMGQITIDGEMTTEKLDLPYDKVKGKQIVVKGETREFTMTYDG